jgi:opacity protein-like surface antigen
LNSLRNLRFLLAAVLVLAALPAAVLAGTAAAPATHVGISLNELQAMVQSVLPTTWKVVELADSREPIGWTGDSTGLYVMVEDTKTRFFHPNGFHYYSFYRIWVMPSGWEGEMRRTPYVSDSVPAFLLGVGDDYAAFYHTAGGNTWPDGLKSFCSALKLDRICHSDLTRRIVDLEIEEKLVPEPSGNRGQRDFDINPQRIVGLTAQGTNLYLEYLFHTEDSDPDEQTLDELTDRLAGSVFSLIPEVDSLYLRRCTSDTYTDTIVSRN